MEHVLLVFVSVSQVPSVVLLSSRNVSRNLLHNTSKLPSVHQDRGHFSTVGAVHEHHLTDVVHERLHIVVNCSLIENLSAEVNDTCEVVFHDVSLSKNLA